MERSKAAPQVQARMSEALAWAKPRMHKAAPGTACSCGGCAHTVALAARRFDVPAGALREQVGLSNGEAPAPKPPKPRQPLMGQVGANAIVYAGGEQMPAALGLIALAATARGGDDPAQPPL